MSKRRSGAQHPVAGPQITKTGIGGGGAEQPASRRFAIDLVDPLFAVALHVGFVEGLCTQAWFKSWRAPSGSDEVFYCWVFFLGIFNLLMSWIGYHLSIATKPIKGSVRFFLDILLVFLYAAALVKSDNFMAVLGLLSVIYSIYFLWDIFKVIEYRDQYLSFFPRRETVTLLFALLNWMLLFATAKGLDRQASLVIALALSFLYRVSKGFSIDNLLGIKK